MGDTAVSFLVQRGSSRLYAAKIAITTHDLALELEVYDALKNVQPQHIATVVEISPQFVNLRDFTPLLSLPPRRIELLLKTGPRRAFIMTYFKTPLLPYLEQSATEERQKILTQMKDFATNCSQEGVMIGDVKPEHLFLKNDLFRVIDLGQFATHFPTEPSQNFRALVRRLPELVSLSAQPASR